MSTTPLHYTTLGMTHHVPPAAGGEGQADASPAPLTCPHELLHACAVLEHNAVVRRFHQLKEKPLRSRICVAHG